jgi:hypothetical protein
MRNRSVASLLFTLWALVSCSPAGPEGYVLGEWVRDGHPNAWFIAFERDGGVTFSNQTLDMEVTGNYTMADSTRIEITIDQPSRWLPESLAFTVSGLSEDRFDMVDTQGEEWTLVRYGPIPRELLGRWLTLPRNDPRYFIEIEEPHHVLWRRKFGMKRSEDRVGAAWTRGDSLYLHIWGVAPMHYVYEISGDTLAFERPGIGKFGMYRRAP